MPAKKAQATQEEMVDVVYKAFPTASAFHKSSKFVRGIRGPVGGGKTVTCVMELYTRALEQEPYRPLGSPETPEDRSWLVPVCAAFPGDDGRQRVCHLLTTDRGTLPLGDDGCPAWVLTNADMRGYYRIELE